MPLSPDTKHRRRLIDEPLIDHDRQLIALHRFTHLADRRELIAADVDRHDVLPLHIQRRERRCLLAIRIGNGCGISFDGDVTLKCNCRRDDFTLLRRRQRRCRQQEVTRADRVLQRDRPPSSSCSLASRNETRLPNRGSLKIQLASEPIRCRERERVGRRFRDLPLQRQRVINRRV